MPKTWRVITIKQIGTIYDYLDNARKLHIHTLKRKISDDENKKLDDMDHKTNEEKLDDEKQIVELLSTYYIYDKGQRVKKHVKLSSISPKGPPHSVKDSFWLIPEHIPRVLVIGETGCGKSSLCNKLAGIYYKSVEKSTKKNGKKKKKKEEDDSDSSSSSEDDDDIEYNIEIGGKKEEIFESGSSNASVTQETKWAQIRLLHGDLEDKKEEKQELIVIDTPGLNDGNVENGILHRKELESKLLIVEKLI